MQDRGKIRRILRQNNPENAGWLASLLHAQLFPPKTLARVTIQPGKNSSRARLIVNFKYTTLTRSCCTIQKVAGPRSGLCFRWTVVVHGPFQWSVF